ncbi:glycosyltransferase family 2 protein [Bellilinea sp.]|uniref:glycosyltransferase family 2 protein n=1 Tax=Bellilinea sp. TaxID=2838785 RepID=UPI002ADE95DD|nr:glycosyltransferase family 2 protein [Bellilinea sp.]
MLKNLFTIIVNWNLAEPTMACIDSLIKAGLFLENIIVVDNGSTDHSVEKIRKKFGDKIIFIINNENKGFAAAANQGINEALNRGADWVFLINNDAYIAEDFFLRISQNLKEDYDIISPLIYYHSPPNKIWFVGEKTVPGTLFSYSRWKNKIDRGKIPPVLKADFANGAGMIVKRKVFETIGLFDNDLFMYGEEVDFCWRAKMKNFKCVGINKAKMWHLISASTYRNSSRRNYLKTRNQVIFFRRYSIGIQRFINLLLFFMITSLRGLIQIFHLDFNGAYSFLKGWFDGCRFKIN